MGEKARHNSLLPYLHPQAGHCLRLSITLKSETPQALEKIPYPFVVVENSNPFARTLEASFVTDTGSPVERLFLSIQRPRPLIPKDPLFSITNEQVANLWQASFNAFSRAPDTGMLQLSCQTDSGGLFSQLRPLLFCKNIKRFFHPLCPHCGSELDQCEDDQALASAKLPVFSATVHRYLYCESCFKEQRGPAFYTESREGEDPEVVGDLNELISGFSSLLKSPSLPPEFPCAGCTHNAECYGSGNLALKRIVPFSFLPFYMLVFEAPTLPVADFISLISRAQKTELIQALEAQQETARIARLESLLRHGMDTLTFMRNKEGSFLEVLFLKLALFKQLLEMAQLFVEPVSSTGLLPSLGALWVRLPESDGLLPTFWDFHVCPVGLMVEPSSLPAIQKPSPVTESLTLAVLWSYIFLTNKVQGLEEAIQGALEVVDRPLSGPEELPPVFSPGNIFWDPQSSPQLPENFLSLWQEVVGLGLMAFKAWQGKEKDWSLEEFATQVNSLSNKVKEALFEEPVPTPSIAPPEKERPESAEIVTILEDILLEWKSEMETAKEAEKTIVESPPGKLAEKIPLQETIIVSPADQPGGIAELGESQDVKPATSNEEVILEKTIIVSPPESAEPVEPPPKDSVQPEPKAPPAPEMPETIIISDLQGPSTPKPQKKSKSQEDLDKEFEATLSILDQELMGKKPESKPKPEEPLPKRISQDTDIPETIIITPDQKPPSKK